MKIIYNMYRAAEVSMHRACCERATQRYSLGGGRTIYPGSRPAGVTTRSPRMVTECLLTRSMLIKMYYHFMECARTCTMSHDQISQSKFVQETWKPASISSCHPILSVFEKK